MNCNLNGGRIYKGSIAQINVFLYPACATGISGLDVNFYTVSGTSVEKTASDFVISGGVGTVVFQPVELEVFEDGVLRYNVSYELDGEPIVEDLETRWYIKTPIPYTPIDFVTTGNVTEIVMEAISGSGITIEIQEQIDASISGKADTTAVTQSLATKQDTLVSGTNIKTVNNQSLLGSGNIVITSATPTQYTAGPNISIVNDVISVTGITVPTSNTALTNDAHYITAADIPTSNTAFTNDEHFIKSSDIPTSNTAFTNDSGYVNSGQVQTQITNSITGKQDTLVSGTNIKTVNGQSLLGAGNIEITSATPVSYTAGDNISIENGVISVTGMPTSNTALTNDAGYITESAIPTSNTAFTNDADYATIYDIPEVPTSNTAFTNDADYATMSDIPTSNSALTNDEGYITSGDVPTSNTAFTNDAGYITGVTSQQIISALGYTPCRVTAITQSQYTQLQNKDANTIYGITD